MRDFAMKQTNTASTQQKKSVKQFVRFLLDKSLIPLVSYTRLRTIPSQPYTVIDELDKRALQESADYAQQHMQTAIAFRDRRKLWDFALQKMRGPGIVAEFGVWNGQSINYIARNLRELRGGPVIVYGFDSFEGLREDWAGSDLSQGSFDRKGNLPEVDSNVKLIKGWFDETLPTFLAENSGPFAFIHVDCDTFESTESLLSLIGDRIITGTIIVFDEYFAYRGWQVGEFKAWRNYVERTNTRYEYVGFSNAQVALEIR
jgi:predicted O-methyltransferase YrrM